MRPFQISVSWKSLPGLPPCSSGLFRKHLDSVGEILQLLFALGEPVTKAYSSHQGVFTLLEEKQAALEDPLLDIHDRIGSLTCSMMPVSLHKLRRES